MHFPVCILIFTARRGYASAVLTVVILSVCDDNDEIAYFTVH